MATIVVFLLILSLMWFCLVIHSEVRDESIKEMVALARKRDMNKELEKIFGTSDQDLIDYRIKRGSSSVKDAVRDQLEMAIFGQYV